jgi:hypothetical protein
MQASWLAFSYGSLRSPLQQGAAQLQRVLILGLSFGGQPEIKPAHIRSPPQPAIMSSLRARRTSYRDEARIIMHLPEAVSINANVRLELVGSGENVGGLLEAEGPVCACS